MEDSRKIEREKLKPRENLCRSFLDNVRVPITSSGSEKLDRLAAIEYIVRGSYHNAVAAIANASVAGRQ